MPIYEYECPDCGCRFERLESITASREAVCPECGRMTKRMLSSGTGFIIRGEAQPTHNRQKLESPPCDLSAPCCGRETRCEKPPCE